MAVTVSRKGAVVVTEYIDVDDERSIKKMMILYNLVVQWSCIVLIWLFDDLYEEPQARPSLPRRFYIKLSHRPITQLGTSKKKILSIKIYSPKIRRHMANKHIENEYR